MESTMNIINMRSFEDSNYYKEPWEWGVLHNLIPHRWIKKIAEELKTLSFQKVESNRSDKSYCMGVLDLQKKDIKNNFLNELILELTSEKYQAKLEFFTNSQLRGREIEMNFWCYSGTNYLSPHVYKDYKFLTQLIYLNETWEADFGGGLNILRSRKQEDLYEKILPIYSLSPLIKNSKKAWHSVSPVSSNAPSRYCLQMIFKD